MREAGENAPQTIHLDCDRNSLYDAELAGPTRATVRFGQGQQIDCCRQERPHSWKRHLSTDGGDALRAQQIEA